MKFPRVSVTNDTVPGNVSPKAGIESIWSKFGDIANGNLAGRCVLKLTSAISDSRQFSTSTAGNVPLLDDSGICCLHASTISGPLSISGDPVGTRLFIPNDFHVLCD